MDKWKTIILSATKIEYFDIITPIELDGKFDELYIVDRDNQLQDSVNYADIEGSIKINKYLEVKQDFIPNNIIEKESCISFSTWYSIEEKDFDDGNEEHFRIDGNCFSYEPHAIDLDVGDNPYEILLEYAEDCLRVEVVESEWGEGTFSIYCENNK